MQKYKDTAIRGEFAVRYDEHAKGRTIPCAIDHYRIANKTMEPLFTPEMWERIAGARLLTAAEIRMRLDRQDRYDKVELAKRTQGMDHADEVAYQAFMHMKHHRIRDFWTAIRWAKNQVALAKTGEMAGDG